MSADTQLLRLSSELKIRGLTDEQIEFVRELITGTVRATAELAVKTAVDLTQERITLLERLVTLTEQQAALRVREIALHAAKLLPAEKGRGNAENES